MNRNGVRKAGRTLGLGRAALHLYHRPVGLIRQSIAEGGPLQQRRTAAGCAEMMSAAERLPPLSAPPSKHAAEVAFLSGSKYWHQTAFCFVSLQINCPFRITPVVYDDGSFTPETQSQLRRVVPWVRFIDADEIENTLNEKLPASTFPALRARRIEYPHLRKLTDIHAASWQTTLVLDSDMLFFRKPTVLLDWFGAPHPIYMQDVMTSYGYPSGFLAQLAGRPMADSVNVGLYALDGSRINWERIEHWCKRQLDDHGPRYLQEQALTAMVLTLQDGVPLPRADYLVLPDLEEGRNPTAVLHHYVAHSKRSYFQHGWQRVYAGVGARSRATRRIPQ